MTQGLSQWPGQVDLLEADVIPHMGWNTVQVSDSSKLFRGIGNERFYFVHSYGVQNWVMSTSNSQDPPILAWTTHGKPFIAAVENGPLTATQFHPEKSGEAGIRLLRNWISGLKNG
jgi:glutamine amidotransferase